MTTCMPALPPIPATTGMNAARIARSEIVLAPLSFLFSAFVEVMTNNTLLAAFSHTVSSAFLVAGTFVAGICGWWSTACPRCSWCW